MGRRKELPPGAKRLLGEIAKSFSPTIDADWLLERVDLHIDRYAVLAILEAILLALEHGNVEKPYAKHIKVIGKYFGKQLIREGFDPTDEIREDWQKHFGLLKPPKLKSVKG